MSRIYRLQRDVREKMAKVFTEETLAYSAIIEFSLEVQQDAF